MTLPRSFQVDRSSNTPLTQQIFEHYQEAIRSGGIPFGTRLPSIRDLSAHLGVNKISIIGAYEKLVDVGLAVSRPGSGFYVSHRPRRPSGGTVQGQSVSLGDASPGGAINPGHGTPPNASLHPQTAGGQGPFSQGPTTRLSTRHEAGHEAGPRGNPFAQMHRVLLSTWSAPTNLTSLGSSHIPVEQVVLDELRSVARHVLLDSEKVNLAYEHPQGNMELRERIAAELELRGLPVVGADQVLITSGALQALNLALDVLTQPGDAVAVEVPAFSLLFPLLAHKRLRLVEMPRSFEGFEITAESELGIKRERPKVIIVCPNFHNPLGGTLSAHQRHEVVRLASETGATIIEMDPFHGLTFGDFMQPPLAALDALHRTLYISSFSKTLSPGLRLGYACGSPALLSRMVNKKTVLDISTSSLDQAFLCEFMSRGLLRKHLTRVKELYRSRRDTLTAMLRKLAPQGARWTTPEGGIFLWFDFPPGPLASDIEQVSLERKVVLAPGNLFFPEGRASTGMRLNFAGLEPVHTYKALETVFALWRAANSRRWAGLGGGTPLAGSISPTDASIRGR
jgi:2-aminoadipate transaminase